MSKAWQSLKTRGMNLCYYTQPHPDGMGKYVKVRYLENQEAVNRFIFIVNSFHLTRLSYHISLLKKASDRYHESNRKHLA